MADVIFVAVIVAFFALCVVYIRFCDRIIGPDVFPADVSDELQAETSAVEAPTSVTA